jgi:hypothetical protein
MANRSVFHSKHGKNIEEGKSRTAGHRSGTDFPDEFEQELSPLDIINQDTDLLTDDVQYVFKLPPAPQEIADYLGHYFLPAEKAEEATLVRYA